MTQTRKPLTVVRVVEIRRRAGIRYAAVLSNGRQAAVGSSSAAAARQTAERDIAAGIIR